MVEIDTTSVYYKVKKNHDAFLDSLKNLTTLQGDEDAPKLKEPDEELLQSVSALDDIAVNYMGDLEGPNNQYIVQKGKFTGVDVSKIFDALNRIDLEAVDPSGSLSSGAQNIDNPEFYKTWDQLAIDNPELAAAKEIYDLGYFQYPGRTPRWGGYSKKMEELRKEGGHLIGPPQLSPRYKGWGRAEPVVNLEDIDTAKKQGWTAANAWDISAGNIWGDNTWFNKYHNTFEQEYDKLVSEDQWFDIMPDTWVYNERVVPALVEHNYGTDTYDKIDVIAREKADKAILDRMLNELTNDPDSNKSLALLNSLKILDKYSKQYGEDFANQGASFKDEDLGEGYYQYGQQIFPKHGK